MQAVSPAILTTDQSEGSIKSVPMAQSTHSLLPGHMGPDVEIPTLRGGGIYILQTQEWTSLMQDNTFLKSEYDLS